MEIKTKENGNFFVISVSGRLDTSNYEIFADKLKDIIEKGKKFLILDLQGLEYISSSGLRVFLSTLKSIRAIEGDVVLCCLNDKIKSIFEVSGFISLFRVESKLENIK